MEKTWSAKCVKIESSSYYSEDTGFDSRLCIDYKKKTIRASPQCRHTLPNLVQCAHLHMLNWFLRKELFMPALYAGLQRRPYDVVEEKGPIYK
jgi:hypothetical protein